jgi:hypothetical protein
MCTAHACAPAADAPEPPRSLSRTNGYSQPESSGMNDPPAPYLFDELVGAPLADAPRAVRLGDRPTRPQSAQPAMRRRRHRAACESERHDAEASRARAECTARAYRQRRVRATQKASKSISSGHSTHSSCGAASHATRSEPTWRRKRVRSAAGGPPGPHSRTRLVARLASSRGSGCGAGARIRVYYESWY